MPEAGYFTNLGLVFPSKELRDPEGIIRRGKAAFPMYGVNSFTTTGTLYKIEFFLIIKVFNLLHIELLPLTQSGTHVRRKRHCFEATNSGMSTRSTGL